MNIATPDRPVTTRSCRRRPFRALAAIALVVCATHASPALAASGDDDEVLPDARLMGYTAKVNVDGGVAMSYALLFFLGLLAVGITFKSANRSHLD